MNPFPIKKIHLLIAFFLSYNFAYGQLSLFENCILNESHSVKKITSYGGDIADHNEESSKDFQQIDSFTMDGQLVKTISRGYDLIRTFIYKDSVLIKSVEHHDSRKLKETIYEKINPDLTKVKMISFENKNKNKSKNNTEYYLSTNDKGLTSNRYTLNASGDTTSMVYYFYDENDHQQSASYHKYGKLLYMIIRSLNEEGETLKLLKVDARGKVLSESTRDIVSSTSTEKIIRTSGSYGSDLQILTLDDKGNVISNIFKKGDRPGVRQGYYEIEYY